MKREIRLIESTHASEIESINRKHQVQLDEHFYSDREKTRKIENMEQEVLKLPRNILLLSRKSTRSKQHISIVSIPWLKSTPMSSVLSARSLQVIWNSQQSGVFANKI